METKEEDLLFLPPGFRFHPSDEEIITHYLLEKVRDPSFNAVAMGEADLNMSEPWELPSKAKMGEKEWYFFCQKERRYSTSMRTNRATNSGYWKATGKDREIHRNKGSTLVGMKKTLVFYKGRAPKGEKTYWVIHEFRLEGDYSLLQRNHPNALKGDWVVVRVFYKKEAIKTSPSIEPPNTMEEVMSQSVVKTHLLPPIPLFSTASASKLEQLSNSIVSAELSNNDWNTDISSYDDLENMWKY